MIKEEIKYLPAAKVLSKNCNKKAKIINKECRHENGNNALLYATLSLSLLNLIIPFVLTDSSASSNEDFDNYRNINIYIDIIAMLLKANIKDADEEKFYNEEMNILQVIAHALPELFKYFRVSNL